MVGGRETPSQSHNIYCLYVFKFIYGVNIYNGCVGIKKYVMLWDMIHYYNYYNYNNFII